MISVASCSSQSLRKRKNEGACEMPDIKVRRNNVYFVLESESEIPSSEEDVDSVCSLQNKSTDFAKDTSDTYSTSRKGSDFESLAGVEYEVASLSEHEAPFNSCSSGPESGIEPLWDIVEGEEDNNSVWADGSSAAVDADVPEPSYFPLRRRKCLKCKQLTSYPQFCHICYEVRKNFFPPRPKPFRKKNIKSSNKKNPELKETKAEKTVSQWLESSSSQDLTQLGSSYESEGLCNICLKNPRNGAFLHNTWVHIYSCYQCSLKIWFSTKCCPLCNCKIKQVLKVAIG